jgi:hypothetical protein
MMTHNKRRGFTLIDLSVVFGISALLSAQLLPVVQSSRESARRTQCKYNLHELGLALHNYADTFGARMPCGWYQHSWDGDEGEAFGWNTSILPYIDHARLFNDVNFDVGPREQSSEVTTAMRELRIEVLRCPNDPSPDINATRGGWSASNYSANFGHLPLPRWETGTLTSLWPGTAATPNDCGGTFRCNWGARFADMVDGQSNIILLGERAAGASNGIWMGVRGNSFENDAVTDASRFSPINGGVGTFGSVHEGGAHFLMGDGAVHFISDEVNMTPEDRAGLHGLVGMPHRECIMEKLSCRNDGMPVEPF